MCIRDSACTGTSATRGSSADASRSSRCTSGVASRLRLVKCAPSYPQKVETAADDSSRATTDATRAEGSTRAERNAAGVLARHARAAGFPESHSRRGRDPPPRAAAVPTCSTDDTATASDTFSRDTTDRLFDHTNESLRTLRRPNLDFKNAYFPRTREAGRV